MIFQSILISPNAFDDTMIPKIEFQQVQKKYPNGFEAIGAFDLQIQNNEMIALLGPSGCGKSTLLRMVAGLEEISGGSLYFSGQRVNDIAPQHRDLSMVFQSYALYPHLSAYENIAFGLRLRKIPDAQIDQRIKSLSKRLEIEHLLTRKPKEMSGGQRQRIAIARALAKQSSILLFDEPLSNLDTQLRSHMRVEIAKLHREFKTTSLYVTHDQVEAMTLANRIVLMKSGKIQQVGTPLNLYHEPVNRFVAGFIGSPSMNFFEAEILDQKLQAKGFSCPLPSSACNLQNLQNGQKVIVGIRPNAFRIQAIEKRTHAQLDNPELRISEPMSLIVELVEPLGNENLLYCKLNQNSSESHSFRPDQLILVRQDPNQTSMTQQGCMIQVGDLIEVLVDFREIHLFENTEIGQRICVV
jgi:multiple sugar transport system ATP-binding protein